MELTLVTGPLAQIETDTLIVLSSSPAAAEVNSATGLWLDEIKARGEFDPESDDTALLHRPSGLAAKHLLVLGSGKPAKFDAGVVRNAAGAAARIVKGKGCRECVFVVDSDPAMVEAAAEGFVLGAWEPDQHKTDPKKNDKSLERVRLFVAELTHELDASLATGLVLAEAQNFTRSLTNEPSNVLTPTRLAEAAQALAAESGLECEVLDRARMQQLGMGSLLGVAQGSLEPPFLVILRYRPAQPASDVHLGLVGKGVTFDTGGISIKPSDGMEKMKYDMAGAASVIGAMKAIAALKPAIAVTAVAPCVENMPGGAAQRPGDIVKSLNGKTVEVLNTDAEGRLILIDALTYAIRHLGCTHLVDAATLTGAIAVALASVHAGLFTNNDELRDRLLAAARREGEKLWPLPMDDEYRKMLKSDFADIPNITGQRYGGASTAAKFLEEFVEDKPWAHLDIAGTAWLDDGKPWMSKGPSGITVRTLVRLALGWGG